RSKHETEHLMFIDKIENIDEIINDINLAIERNISLYKCGQHQQFEQFLNKVSNNLTISAKMSVIEVLITLFLENTNQLYSISPETSQTELLIRSVIHTIALHSCIPASSPPLAAYLQTLRAYRHDLFSNPEQHNEIIQEPLVHCQKNEFAQHWINPKVVNAQMIKDSQRTLENEINKTLDVDEKYQLNFHPRIWRRV
ncbi:16367_t:CDS:2, partial [Racocetra fulgida]